MDKRLVPHPVITVMEMVNLFSLRKTSNITHLDTLNIIHLHTMTVGFVIRIILFSDPLFHRLNLLRVNLIRNTQPFILNVNMSLVFSNEFLILVH